MHRVRGISPREALSPGQGAQDVLPRKRMAELLLVAAIDWWKWASAAAIRALAVPCEAKDVPSLRHPGVAIIFTCLSS